MSSNLEAKRVIVEEIKEKLQASKGVVFVDYKGINVEQDTALRKSCREKNVTYKVYKNRLFVKALEEDSHAFCEKAKKYELLLVPGDSFGYPGYVRISYCVSTEMIEKSLPSFEKLAKEYK